VIYFVSVEWELIMFNLRTPVRKPVALKGIASFSGLPQPRMVNPARKR